MADKIVIGEVDLDISKATKEAQALKESIELLNKQLKQAEEAGGKTSKEYIELEAALKTTKREYNQQINVIGKSIQADTAKAGSLDQQSAKLAVVTKQWRALSKDERLNTEEGQRLTQQKKELTESLKGEERATGDARRNVGNYGEAVSEATGLLGQFVPAAGQATSAAKTFGTALKFVLGPIGLIIAAGAALVQFFKSSEEGQNKLARVTAVFSTVLGNLSDIVSKVGEVIFDAFTKPQETLEKLKSRVEEIGNFFQNTFGNIIGGAIQGFIARLLKGFAGVGLAWQKLKNVFTDNAEGINKAQERIEKLNQDIENSNNKIKEGAENLGDSVKKGWDKAKEGLSGFIEEQEREIQIAQNLADRQAALDKQIRKNIVQEAQDRLKLEQLKNSVDDKAANSAQERLKIIEEENKILDDILERNLAIAQSKFEIAQAQNELSNSTKEDLEEEAQLQAEIFNIQATITSQRKEAIAKRIEAENEIIAKEKERVDEVIKGLEVELKTWRSSREAQGLIDEEYNQLSLEREEEFLQQKLELGQIKEEEYNLAIQENRLAYEEAERARKLEQEAVDFENAMSIAEGQLFVELDLERKFLEEKRLQEIKFAEKIGADTTKIDAKYKKAQRKLDLAEVNSKLTLAQSAASGIAQIAGEQTAIGRAASAAAATISTIQGGISAFTGMIQAVPGPAGIALGVIAAGGVLAQGYAQVKDILSVKSGLPGDSGGGASVGGGGGSISVPVPSTQNLGSRELTSGNVGSGIVSREAVDNSAQSVALGVSQALENSPLQPTLVTDDVTVSQEVELEKTNTSTI